MLAISRALWSWALVLGSVVLSSCRWSAAIAGLLDSVVGSETGDFLSSTRVSLASNWVGSLTPILLARYAWAAFATSAKVAPSLPAYWLSWSATTIGKAFSWSELTILLPSYWASKSNLLILPFAGLVTSSVIFIGVPDLIVSITLAKDFSLETSSLASETSSEVTVSTFKGSYVTYRSACA